MMTETYLHLDVWAKDRLVEPSLAEFVKLRSYDLWLTTGICPPGVDTADTHQLGSPHLPQSTDHLSHSC